MKKWLIKMSEKYPQTFLWWGRFPATIGAVVGSSIQILTLQELSQFSIWFHCYTIIVFSLELIKFYHEWRVKEELQKMIIQHEINKLFQEIG
jgi:hypothetical protein